jgi:hypothetical protein
VERNLEDCTPVTEELTVRCHKGEDSTLLDGCLEVEDGQELSVPYMINPYA